MRAWWKRRKPAAEPLADGAWAGGAAASPPDREAALACRPALHPQVAAQATAQGLARLRYPVAVKPWLGAVARRLGLNDGPMWRTLELDAMGTAVLGWIDGRRTVAELAALLRERYGLHPREAEAALTAFLRELGRRGIIGLGG